MNKTRNNTNRIIGGLFISGAVALLIPYNILTISFDYPDILRQDTATVLTRFHQGGSQLIWIWFAFAISGIPLIPAYILLGKELESESALARIATSIGVVGLIVQMVGLLRWTFVVPMLSEIFVTATDETTKAATIVAFKTIHQFAGVILGENLGQLFTIIWTVMITITLHRTKVIPTWMAYFGYGTSGIYLLAQAELFATVMNSIPVWDLAGFLGSTLWLVWLVILGVFYLTSRAPEADIFQPISLANVEDGK